MAKNNRSKKQPLFSADRIATLMDQAIKRDMADLAQVQGVDHRLQQYVRDNQNECFLKKYVSSAVSPDTLDELTYLKFLEVNEHLSSFNDRDIFPIRERILPSDDEYTKSLLRARWIVHRVLGDLDMDEWFEGCKNSSGSSIGVSYNDTSVEAKFTYPISVGTRAKSVLDYYFTYDASLSRAVENFNSSRPLAPKYEIVDHSRATTVPKTNKINRMIAVEPTGNMFLQQGLMALMYKRLKKVGLDVETLPTKHQRLAYGGSITRRIATVDFTSASDCVSIELLSWLLPPKWFRYLSIVRSESVLLNHFLVPLQSFSTMGNAGTFPLETLVFWALCMSHRSNYTGNTTFLEKFESARRKYSVFGDDCILPSDEVEDFLALARYVGFIPNSEKSHWEATDTFRESCGGDFDAGRDVRAIYLRGPNNLKMSSLEPWLYTVLNRTLKRYMSYFGPLTYVYNRSLLATIFKVFTEFNIKVKLVPPYFPEDSGLAVNEDLQRLSRCYRFEFEPIYRDKHGTYTFKYVRFQYTDRKHKDMGIRLALWLKKPSFSTRSKLESDNPRFTRRKGGYVVARGLSSHWELPHLGR